MEHERRGVTRYNFGAIAEVVDLDGRAEVVSLTRDLSFSGVFVKTTTPLPTGTRVRVRITYSGVEFAATGKITANVTPTAMGIAFTEIEPSDRTIVEKWLGNGVRTK
jgi:hypothetical protein